MNLHDIGILSIGTRMKKLYDVLIKDVKQLYSNFDVDFDPKWFAVIYVLYHEEKSTITQLSSILKQSHPSIVQITKELEKNQWVITSKSKIDKRQTIVSLSDKAILNREKLSSIWSNMRETLEKINQEGQVDFWEGLKEFESSLIKKTFKERVYETHFENEKEHQESMKSKLPGIWFDRKFTFENQSVSFEGLIERLSFTSLRIESKIKNLSERELSLSIDNKWSIKENIGHLNDLESLWYGRVYDIVSGKEIIREADLKNIKTHEAKHNDIPLKRLLQEFTSNRSKFVNSCKRNQEIAFSKSGLHPRLKKEMRIIDLMYFIAEHDDHHLATISYIVDTMKDGGFVSK